MAEPCPFVPVIVMVLCSVPILLRGVLCSSSPSAAVSVSIVNIVACSWFDAEIIFVTFSVVGIMGVPSATL